MNMKKMVAPLVFLMVLTMACGFSFGMNNPDSDGEQDMEQMPSDLMEATAPPESITAIIEGEVPTELFASEEAQAQPSGEQVETDFPLPEDAENLMELGPNQISFQTGMTIDETISFYRNAFTDRGLTEREILTVTSDITLNMVFDGDPSGEAIVIQAVELSKNTLNITIRYEDV